MNLLVLQETDWIKRGPHQQHHLMDRMALKGHKIHVIDHEYLWKDDNDKKIITGLDHASILYFHNKEIRKQITEFNPDVIIAFGILNAYLGMRQAKKNNIPFVYYLIDHLHTLLPGESSKEASQNNLRERP